VSEVPSNARECRKLTDACCCCCCCCDDSVLDRDTPKQNRIKLVHDGTQLPPREFLDTRSTTVVDAETEIFVWVGRGATVYQRKLAMLVAKKLSTEPHRPSWTSITRIPEEAETILFKEKFSNYPGMLPINVARQEAKGKIAAAQVQEDIDVKKLLRYAPPAPTMFDDGKGQIAKVHRVRDVAESGTHSNSLARCRFGASRTLTRSMCPRSSTAASTVATATCCCTTTVPRRAARRATLCTFGKASRAAAYVVVVVFLDGKRIELS